MKPLDELLKSFRMDGEENNNEDTTENYDSIDEDNNDNEEEVDELEEENKVEEEEVVSNDTGEITLDLNSPNSVQPEVKVKKTRKTKDAANKRFNNIPADRESTLKQRFSVFTRAMAEGYKVQWEKVKLATMTHGEVNSVLSRTVTAESVLKAKGIVPNG